MKKILTMSMIALMVITYSACYKNYYDISTDTVNAINAVSFRNDVVPIVTAGGCGCHNNGSTRQLLFSKGDTIYYSTIQSRAKMFEAMAKGGAHPGEGSIYFTPSQANIIIKWVAQGAKDDYVPPAITGEVTYSVNIVPLYKSDCTGSSCHGGVAKPLDYTLMKSNESSLLKMMNSLGASGHPGGPIVVSPTTAQTFIAWINQGMKP